MKHPCFAVIYPHDGMKVLVAHNIIRPLWLPPRQRRTAGEVPFYFTILKLWLLSDHVQNSKGVPWLIATRASGPPSAE